MIRSLHLENKLPLRLLYIDVLLHPHMFVYEHTFFMHHTIHTIRTEGPTLSTFSTTLFTFSTTHYSHFYSHFLPHHPSCEPSFFLSLFLSPFLSPTCTHESLLTHSNNNHSSNKLLSHTTAIDPAYQKTNTHHTNK